MNKEEKWITLPLDKCFLCPGTLDSEPHVTTNAFQCACGNQNLASLSRILNREVTVEVDELTYAGICADQLPLIDQILGKADC